MNQMLCRRRLCQIQNYWKNKGIRCFALMACLLFVLLLSFQQISAQSYLYYGEHLTTDDGLANLGVDGLFKDKDGFIWISTSYGLNRYDGYNFELYNSENSDLVHDKYILVIRQDDYGMLWLFSFRPDKMSNPIEQGVDIFDPNTRENFSLEEYIGPENSPDITKINILQYHDPKNRIWLNTIDGDLYLLAGRELKKVYSCGEKMTALAFDGEGHIYIGHNNKVSTINLNGDLLNTKHFDSYIMGMWLDKNEIFISTLSWEMRDFKSFKESLIYTWNTETYSKPERFYLKIDGEKIELTGFQFHFLYRSKLGFWYAVYEGHILLFDSEGNWKYNYTEKLNNKSISDLKYALEYDNFVWFSSPVGVFKTHIEKNNFTLFHSRENQRYSDSRGIVEDANGDIYFNNSRLFRWKPKTKELEQLSNYPTAFNIFALENEILTSNAGNHSLLFNYNKKTGEIKEIVNGNKNYGTIAFSFSPSKKNNKLLIATNVGLVYYDWKLQKYAPFEGYNGFEKMKFATCSHIEEYQNNKWITTSEGIFLANENEEIIQHFSAEKNDLPFNFIRHIHIDSEGVFWLTTKGKGIIKWWPNLDNESKPKYEHFTVNDGLSNNYTYAILEDDYGFLWISSDKGLMRMNKETNEISTFYVKQGLPHDEFNFTSFLKAKNGLMYFGGLGGIISFDPEDFLNHEISQTVKSPLVLTRFSILEKGDDLMTNKTLELKETNEIIIKPGDKLVDLEFSLLDYAPNEEHLYAYKIEGYTNNWNTVKGNYLRITGLPYGKYVLKIKGKNRQYGWSENIIEIKLKVQRPFYMKFWFIALMILTGIGSLYLIALYRISKLKSDKTKLEEEVEKRTEEIKKDKVLIEQQTEQLKELDKVKSKFFSNIAHEFRTPLTLIIGPIKRILKNTKSPINKELSLSLKNALLLKDLINQLLDISKLENKQMKIEITEEDIILLTQDIIERFKPLIENKKLKLSFIHQENNWITTFDKDKWNKIIHNLLSNAIKFTPENGNITLSLNDGNSERIYLEVADSGIGMDEEELKHIFDRFYQTNNANKMYLGTGIGLALVKELIELQGGSIRADSVKGKGSSFFIELPVLQGITETKKSNINEEYLAPILFEESKPDKSKTLKENNELNKVLIVEDNSDMLYFIRSCIPDRYQVIEALNGVQGLDLALEHIPDVILSDIMMPLKDGLELCLNLRSNHSTSHIPVILLSAKSSLESRLKGLKRGADVYLSKPFSPEELILHVDRLIHLRSLQQYSKPNTNIELLPFEREDEFIHDLNAFIEAHIDEPNLNGEMIGKHFGMSRMQLHRKLKALKNNSIGSYVKSFRLDKAKELLLKKELNISEIAFKTGFSSLSHFSRSFKEKFGKSPSQL